MSSKLLSTSVSAVINKNENWGDVYGQDKKPCHKKEHHKRCHKLCICSLKPKCGPKPTTNVVKKPKKKPIGPHIIYHHPPMSYESYFDIWEPPIPPKHVIEHEIRQTRGIITNKKDITKNTKSISSNKQNINKNVLNISANKKSIIKNTENIKTNVKNISLNKSDINKNVHDIASNLLLINSNKRELDQDISDINDVLDKNVWKIFNE